jgi:hypothetical protein
VCRRKRRAAGEQLNAQTGMFQSIVGRLKELVG